MNNQEIELRLWDYIDGNLPYSERSSIEKLIEERQEWRDKYSELLEISLLLTDSELDQPSMRFTKNVMEEISKFHIAPAAKQYIDNKIIWSIGALFISMLTGCLFYAFGQSSWSEAGEGSHFAETVKSVDYSAFTNNTVLSIFMMANVVLGLLFLDRYLTNKRQSHKS